MNEAVENRTRFIAFSEAIQSIVKCHLISNMEDTYETLNEIEQSLTDSLVEIIGRLFNVNTSANNYLKLTFFPSVEKKIEEYFEKDRVSD